MGYIFLHYGDYESALKKYQTALQVYESLDSISDLIIVYHNLATVYDFLSEDSLAIEYYKKSITAASKNGVDAATSYNNIGWLYRDIGNYQTAFDFFHKALDYYDRKGDDYRIGMTLHNIGSIYMEWNDYKTSLLYFRKALPLLSTEGENKRLADLYSDMGEAHFNIDAYSRADSLFHLAEKIYTSLDYKAGLVNVFLNNGQLLHKQSQYDEALAYLNESAELANVINNKRAGAEVALHSGLIYEKKGQMVRAKKHFKEALEIAGGTASHKIIMEAYYGLSRIAQLNNNYHEALVLRDRYMNLKDSLFNIQKFRRINEIKSKYESKKFASLIKEKEDQLEEARETNEMQKIIIVFLVIGGLFVVVGLYFIYRFYSQLKISNQELKVKNIQVSENRNALIAAKERAEESERLKTAFLANISHEIRTPMNGIVGFSKLLQERSLSNQKKDKYIAIINKNSNLLLKLINDILELSKIELKQITLKPTEYDLDFMFESLKVQFGEKLNALNKEDIKLEYKPSDVKIKSVYLDGDRLYQIFMNLLENSIKFTEIGVISFGYENHSDQMKFFVRDTGIGIDHELQKVVFERFRQGDSSETRMHGGTGLGLSIVRGLVHLMNGEIWIDSEKGKGSTFYFTLPVKKKVQSMEADSLKKEGTIQEKMPVNWAGKTILVAEDEELNFFYIKETLEETNVKLLYAENGRKAVDIIRNNPSVDLVLMDIKMPVMDGYEATGMIKKERNNLPVVAQTAYAMTGEKRKSFEAGCDDYLFKPIKPDLLISTISKYI
jgi:signal transduction histidine kinase